MKIVRVKRQSLNTGSWGSFYHYFSSRIPMNFSVCPQHSYSLKIRIVIMVHSNIQLNGKRSYILFVKKKKCQTGSNVLLGF